MFKFKSDSVPLPAGNKLQKENRVENIGSDTEITVRQSAMESLLFVPGDPGHLCCSIYEIYSRQKSLLVPARNWKWIISNTIASLSNQESLFSVPFFTSKDRFPGAQEKHLC